MPPSISKKRGTGKRRQKMGLFPNLEQHRLQAGFQISDLAALLNDGGPSERSLRRLEDGYSIRLASVHRVFNVLDDKLGNSLDRNSEIVEVK